jgi:2-dehydro-3-deoxyphosphogluconate aldolase/(4S)-4-hydroxy-2-oxoglutarate aldolase
VIPEVLAEAGRLGVPVVCGAFTLTEVLAAHRLGAALVKLFPAWLGGPAYVAAITNALPHIPLVPTGGVELETVGAFVAAGATAVAIGRPVVGDALHGGDLDGVRTRARALLAAAGAGDGDGDDGAR